MVFQECERHPRSPEDMIEDPSHGFTENGLLHSIHWWISMFPIRWPFGGLVNYFHFQADPCHSCHFQDGTKMCYMPWTPKLGWWILEITRNGPQFLNWIHTVCDMFFYVLFVGCCVSDLFFPLTFISITGSPLGLWSSWNFPSSNLAAVPLASPCSSCVSEPEDNMLQHFFGLNGMGNFLGSTGDCLGFPKWGWVKTVFITLW